MRELILEALRESVKRYPDIVPYLEGKAAWLAISDKLALWQAKAVTQLRNGEPALCEFEREMIPEPVAEMVKNLLAYAESEDQIKQGFIDLEVIITQPTPSVKGIIDRDELEKRLMRVIDRSLRDELKKLLEYLGDPPDLGNVPYDYWQNGWKKLRRVVEPILVDTYLSYAEAAMAKVGIGVEWTLVNRRASNWARDHGNTILKQLFDHTYEGVSETVPQYFEQGWTSKELAHELERYYSPVRAEMIAVTETTRAAVEGERAYVAELEASTGRRMVPIWLTANDDKVCPICNPKPPDKPRHEMPITDGVFPPAHPRCRCGVAWEFETTLNPEQAVLWQSR